jgi:hypothetical protein
MDRKAYGYSRMLIEFQDGALTGPCSLRCAVAELDENPGRPVKAIRVADRDTRRLTDARDAVWVMGGRKPGVMTPVAKWAFGSRAAADAFVKANGGRVVTWSEALGAAREELENARRKPSRRLRERPRLSPRAENLSSEAVLALGKSRRGRRLRAGVPFADPVVGKGADGGGDLQPEDGPQKAVHAGSEARIPAADPV